MSDEDRENKLREGLYVDDERKAVFDTDKNGKRVIHRHFGGEWHTYSTGGSDDEGGDDNDD